MNSFKMLKIMLGLLAASLLSACDQGGGSGSSSSMTISGSLGGPSGASSKPSLNKVGVLAVTDYAVRCVTLDDNPQAGSGNVNADGSFSLSIAASASDSVPIGCFVIKAADSSVAANAASEAAEPFFTAIQSLNSP